MEDNNKNRNCPYSYIVHSIYGAMYKNIIKTRVSSHREREREREREGEIEMAASLNTKIGSLI